MKISILLIAVSMVLFAGCENQKSDINTGKIEAYRQHHQLFEKADHSLTGFYRYSRFEDFDFYSLTDTLAKCHADIFADKAVVKALNADIKAWLRDSVFIGLSNTKAGKFVMDTVNLMRMSEDEDFRYYTKNEMLGDQKLAGKIFLFNNQVHTTIINGKRISYDIFPSNPKRNQVIGEYRVLTSGDYRPHDLNGNGTAETRYFCDMYSTDWFFIISSDDFKIGEIAIKISGNSFFYEEFGTRQEKL